MSRAVSGQIQQVAWRTFLTAHAVLVRKIDAEVAGAGGLPIESYDVLLTLREAPERRLRLSELADKILLTRSGVTRLVDRLEKEGLIRRATCPGDRRGAYAVLTERGAEAFEASRAIHVKAIAAHFGDRLHDDEAVIINSALRRMILAVNGPEIVPVDGLENPPRTATP